MLLAQASNIATYVDRTFIFIVSVSLFFLVLITGLMIYFVTRYSRKRNPKATNIHGNILLEITWTVIPTLLTLVMFWYGWTDYKYESEPPKDSYVIDVFGQMWKWTFKYPNGLLTDSLFLPLDKDIRVNIHSKDVNHSFYVPAFRVKKDAIPGRNNYAWFHTQKSGVYNLFCAEYCGLRHSYMITKVVVIPENNFNDLLSKRLAIMNDTTKTQNK